MIMAHEHEATGLERYFGEFIQRLAGDRSCPELAAVVDQLSRARAEGHICINLADVAGDMGVDGLAQMLLATPVVGWAGDKAPLIIDGPYLYLQRYHQAETLVADFIMRRQECCQDQSALLKLSQLLTALFPGSDADKTDWQQVAAMAALTRKFTVISGGPGTGKTTTVAKILALYQELHRGQGKCIRLAAPTGKAAARLQESIQGAKGALPISEEAREELPSEAVTIHRLLGLAKGRPRYNRHHPLAVDLVVVDEASMVDLPLMAQLMEALPDECALMLLGDHYQLSSVQPGAVLGDICSGGAGFSGQFQELARDLGIALGEVSVRSNPLADCIITLRTSYRFQETSGIRRLSAAVNNGRGEEALAILADESCPDVRLVAYGSQGDSLVEDELCPAFARNKNVQNADEQLAALASLGVLCAHRRGPNGVERVNELLVKLLAGGEGGVKPLYPGLPIMIGANSYELQLYNGDTGVVCEDDGRFYAYFQGVDGLRRILARRLPAYTASYAMTVHKSQGSEFDRVVVILPTQPSPVLGRELLYTALTRARQSVEVWGDREIFLQAVATPVQRVSGLTHRLWGAAGCRQLS